MPCCLHSNSFLGFFFSPTVLGHQQITCWKEPATELIFRKFLSLALSFPNSTNKNYFFKKICNSMFYKITLSSPYLRQLTARTITNFTKPKTSVNVVELSWVEFITSSCKLWAYELMCERTCKSANTHVHHQISKTAVITWWQTPRILETLVPVVAKWSGPKAAFLALMLFLASWGNQRFLLLGHQQSTCRKHPTIQLIFSQFDDFAKFSFFTTLISQMTLKFESDLIRSKKLGMPNLFDCMNFFMCSLLLPQSWLLNY